jgi:hypothetical protein
MSHNPMGPNGLIQGKLKGLRFRAEMNNCKRCIVANFVTGGDRTGAFHVMYRVYSASIPRI